MKQELKLDDLVCMNKNKDAAVFQVRKIEGFNIGVIDARMKKYKPQINQAVQWVDRSMVYIANEIQLKNSELA